MTTFWIKPSFEELVDWHANAGEDEAIQIDVRCAADGDDLLEWVYQVKGLARVPRAYIEALFPERDIDEWIEENRRVLGRQRADGLYDAARQELNAAGESSCLLG